MERKYTLALMCEGTLEEVQRIQNAINQLHQESQESSWSVTKNLLIFGIDSLKVQEVNQAIADNQISIEDQIQEMERGNND